jgi:cytochrome c553
MRPRLFWLALPLLLAACRPEDVDHLENTKELAREAENFQPKLIKPAQLLAAARWAGDSLTRTADRGWRAQLAERLAAGGVAAAHPFCRPEKLPAVVKLARELEAQPHRELIRPPRFIAEDDSARAQRPGQDKFLVQQPLVLLPTDAMCLRCHGQEGSDVAAADAKLLAAAYPGKQLTGYQPGQLIGRWSIPMTRKGVAEFYTQKTRKIPKRRRLW